MTTKIARLGLIALLFLGLAAGAQLIAPAKASAQIESVQVGVNGMI